MRSDAEVIIEWESLQMLASEQGFACFALGMIELRGDADNRILFATIAEARGFLAGIASCTP